MHYKEANLDKFGVACRISRNKFIRIILLRKDVESSALDLCSALNECHGRSSVSQSQLQVKNSYNDILQEDRM